MKTVARVAAGKKKAAEKAAKNRRQKKKLYPVLYLFIAILFAIPALGQTGPSPGREFFCPNVTCLIYAIQQSNLNPNDVDTINLVPAVYTLEAILSEVDGPTGLPSIIGAVVIKSSSEKAPAIIERNSDAPAFRLFHVSENGDLTLHGITLRYGHDTSSFGGGAIFSWGRLRIEQSWITNNFSQSGGGGIRNFGGFVQIVDSRVSDNVVVAGGGSFISGGGILNTENIPRSPGPMEIVGSFIHNNHSAGVGGGIFNSGAITITDSSIYENENTIGDGDGAGIFGEVFSPVVLTSSTVSRNQGSGITASQLSLTNSTIINNDGIDVAAFGLPAVHLKNNIIGRCSPGFPPVVSEGFNIIKFHSGLVPPPSPPSVDCQGLIETDLINIDPLLGEWNANEAYYPLLPKSPAIDLSPRDNCPPTDQLGNPRVGQCDSGAVEFQGQGPLLIVRRDVIRAGRSIVARWRAIPTPTSTDWIGLYLPGSPDTAFIDWIYVSCSKTPASPDRRGSCDFPIPDSLEPGTYELRLLANDGFMRLASSDSFMVRPRREGLASQAP
jgi:hypothetical protein